VSLKFVDDFQSCFRSVEALLSGDDPVFLGRIGGSDTAAVINCFFSEQSEALEYSHHRMMVKKYNGYYDLSDLDETYHSYCKTLLKMLPEKQASSIRRIPAVIVIL
jgi:hypothetical protein